MGMTDIPPPEESLLSQLHREAADQHQMAAAPVVTQILNVEFMPAFGSVDGDAVPEPLVAMSLDLLASPRDGLPAQRYSVTYGMTLATAQNLGCGVLVSAGASLALYREERPDRDTPETDPDTEP